MKWTFEIIRSFFVAFGAMQTISNANYLLQKNGLESARRQHKELPEGTADKQMKLKTICMFIFGILFLITGLFSFFTRSNYEFSFIIVMGLYTIYALIEAVYYRFWRTYGAFIISAVLLFVTIFG